MSLVNYKDKSKDSASRGCQSKKRKRFSFFRATEEPSPWSFAVAFNDPRRPIRPCTRPPPPPPPFTVTPQAEQNMALNLSIKDQAGSELGARKQEKQKQARGGKCGTSVPAKSQAASTSAEASKVKKIKKPKTRQKLERDRKSVV